MLTKIKKASYKNSYDTGKKLQEEDEGLASVQNSGLHLEGIRCVEGTYWNSEGRLGALPSKGTYALKNIRDNAKNRRKLKAFKVKPNVEDFVVGRGVTLERQKSLSKRVLLGCLECMKMNKTKNYQLVFGKLEVVVRLPPQVRWLTNGWFYFIFLSEDNADNILERL